MTEPGVKARQVAIEAVERIQSKGAFANIVLSPILDRSGLDQRDRALVTEMVYGTVRQAKSCEWLVERFLFSPVDAKVQAALHVGAYQIVYMRLPDHAAVSATVSAVPRKVRGLVNAVLRKVAADAADGAIDWPDRATKLSFPDWIVDRFVGDHGEADGLAALETMNLAPTVTERSDGYIQDVGSQMVVDVVAAKAGERVFDMCAAPGGKATGMAARGAYVIAADRRQRRSRMVARNVDQLDSSVSVATADGLAPPFPPASFDKVLVDAPCSGLGTLRRRADARWRVDEETVTRLAALQVDLLASASELVRPGGRLVYSVCTVTPEESTAVAATLSHGFTPVELPKSWRTWGSGGLLLPQDIDSDGMSIFVWERED